MKQYGYLAVNTPYITVKMVCLWMGLRVVFRVWDWNLNCRPSKNVTWFIFLNCRTHFEFGFRNYIYCPPLRNVTWFVSLNCRTHFEFGFRKCVSGLGWIDGGGYEFGFRKSVSGLCWMDRWAYKNVTKDVILFFIFYCRTQFEFGFRKMNNFIYIYYPVFLANYIIQCF